LRPEQGELGYKLDDALDAVVSLQAHIPEDAFTASILGTERAGHGVIIGDTGLIVTIGYLVTEADQIWVVTNAGQAVTGHLVGYDYETGFGLIQALGRLDAPVMELGSSDALQVGEELVVAGCGGVEEALKVHVAARREFAGYWEYLLDDAIFTSPSHPFWGGGALIGLDGTLRGIGSLFVQESEPVTEEMPPREGNMIVPIDLLADVKGDLLLHGSRQSAPRPWLGMFSAEASGKVVVAGLWDGGPADKAGLEAGDLLLEIDGKPISDMASMYKMIWSNGQAGDSVPLTVYREKRILEIEITSANRCDFYKKPGLH